MGSSLLVHSEGEVVRFELVHPQGYPRLKNALLEELRSRLAGAQCEGIVIHGSSSCFAAGAEIAEVGALNGINALEFSRRVQLLFEEIAHSPIPVVAALSGYCLGGGLDLALACHWRVASPKAVLAHPGASLGLLTGWGGTQRLPRLLGRSAALEFLLSGNQVGAADALRLGLVDEIVESKRLIPHAITQARRLHSPPPSLLNT